MEKTYTMEETIKELGISQSRLYRFRNYGVFPEPEAKAIYGLKKKYSHNQLVEMKKILKEVLK